MRGEDADYRLEYRISRTRVQQGYVLGGVLAAIGVAIFLIGREVIPDATLIAAGHILAGGIVIGLALRQARDNRPRLVLDADGIWYRDWNARPVPWSLVSGVGTAGSRMSSFVSIEVRDEETLLHIMAPAERRELKKNRLVHLPRLFIPNHSVDVPFSRLLADIEAARSRFGR